MEFDELSNRATKNCAQDCWNRPMSSAIDLSGGVVNRTGYHAPQVLFVSFVVKQFCASARVISLFSRPFVVLTQAAKIPKNNLNHE